MSKKFKYFIRFLKENRAFSTKKQKELVLASKCPNIIRWVDYMFDDLVSDTDMKLFYKWIIYVYDNKFIKNNHELYFKKLVNSLNELNNKGALDKEEISLYFKLLDIYCSLCERGERGQINEYNIFNYLKKIRDEAKLTRNY